ncbi:hypothetical protein BTA51_03825 [Hahella sp. CCB-MM4]|uniref:hypothetical protein n=1 Tax=Hahella sp. (strain CCB-MM4) TaxID=1926491 RepID=UPI000B9B5FF3|nr:hypothetical protein [Hahella sp. CCB-MM4]OZG74159.1 hypothetical protein BTA51_03825 [Hahella sp. CCB-MM4]
MSEQHTGPQIIDGLCLLAFVRRFPVAFYKAVAGILCCEPTAYGQKSSIIRIQILGNRRARFHLTDYLMKEACTGNCPRDAASSPFDKTCRKKALPVWLHTWHAPWSPAFKRTYPNWMNRVRHMVPKLFNEQPKNDLTRISRAIWSACQMAKEERALDTLKVVAQEPAFN